MEDVKISPKKLLEMFDSSEIENRLDRIDGRFGIAQKKTG